MSEILIVTATTNGQTAKVAERVARVLEADGLDVLLCDVAGAGTLRARDHDGVIAGGSVHMGHHQPELVRWTRRNAAALSRLPSAFFSLSLTAATDAAAAREFVEDFLDDTGWTPRATATFAGAVRNSQYDVATRVFMRLMMARHGHRIEPDRDYELTDWAAVDRFARAFAARQAASSTAGSDASTLICTSAP
jgi:menaquinone-dependent protoporphyrinogen oxidase